MSTSYRRERLDGGSALTHFAELLDLYREVYAEPPYSSGPLWHADAFAERTQQQAVAAGFDGFTARLPSGDLIGYAFGLPFEPGRWWRGATAAPADVLPASKFAIIELIVSNTLRGQGIGRELLNTLLSQRPEQYATLTALPDAPARQFYRHLGWQQAGTIPAAPDRPPFDVLLQPLPPPAATEPLPARRS